MSPDPSQNAPDPGPGTDDWLRAEWQNHLEACERMIASTEASLEFWRSHAELSRARLAELGTVEP